jgi:tRNA pseudouridine38-40 synthase
VTVKIVLAYDGTGYAGWQRQQNGVSIQQLVEDALSAIEGQPTRVVGAGRTDAGVHALGQVASAALSGRRDTPTIERALNARLPEAVRVLKVEEAQPEFNARFAASSKTYRYRMLLSPIADPFSARYAWLLHPPLDVPAMAEAAAMLEGRHDFAAFQSTGSAVQSSVRELTRVVVSEGPVGDPWTGMAWAFPGRLVALEVTGDGFLRHMVRAMAGTLVEVALGRSTAEDVRAALTSRDRGRAGATAPPHGLFLVRVDYKDEQPPAASR